MFTYRHYSKEPKSTRHNCKQCGRNIKGNHPFCSGNCQKMWTYRNAAKGYIEKTK